MCFSSTTKQSSGFTLIEIMIVAPVVILVISGFVALMIAMVGDVLVSRDQNSMTFDTQDALDRIEQDVRLSTQFLVTSGTMPSPQGSDGNFTGTAAFSNTTSTLIMGGLNTNKNPVDTTRQLVYYANQPNTCASGLLSYNRILISKVVYFIKDSSLWRRAVLPDNNTNSTPDDNTVCATPWQRNTCSPGYSGSTRCQTNDTELLKNVDSFTIKYFDSPKSTTDIGASQALAATTIEVNLGGKKTTAGRSVTSSGSLRATKLNNIDVTPPIPAVPTVIANVDATSVNFSWDRVPLASSYVVSYSINGGSFTNTTTDSLTTSFTVNANLGDTVTMRVQARNSTGSSAYGEATATVPYFKACSLQNGWQDYQSGYSTAAYTKTSTDVVVLKGLVRFGTATANTPICTLPVGYRPDKRLVLATSSLNGAVSGVGRIDIATNGEVRFVSGSNGWISLDGLRFVASTASYTWGAPALLNSWTDYAPVGVDTYPHQTTLDSLGRVHVRGLVVPGVTTAGTAIFALPANQARGTQTTYLPSVGATGFNWDAFSSAIDARLNPGAWLSLNAMFYPGTYAGWTDMTPLLVNNWTWINLANHATPAYVKSADGIVTLKGMIKKATNDDGTVIATLPAGFRPKEQLLTSCVAFGGYCRVDILPNGQIIDNTSANNGWVSLDNVSFIAEQ